MNNQDIINKSANKFLGKQLNNYKNSYDKTLLVPIERSLNRADYKITNDDFQGYDIWHNYECSFMTNNGYPITLVGKIKIPCNSQYFIESKSMKLYFFSFHMEKLGQTKEDAIKKYKEIVINDLSEATKSQVEFEVFEKLSNVSIFKDYQHIEELVDINSVEFNNFKESPDLLQKSNQTGQLKVFFSNIRSNCRVTHQPDFANFYIYIDGELPTLDSLLQYVVSFRNEYHFHEEVVEQLYKVLKNKLNLNAISVNGLFTRRGGLDICPCRASSDNLLCYPLINVNLLQTRTIYQ